MLRASSVFVYISSSGDHGVVRRVSQSILVIRFVFFPRDLGVCRSLPCFVCMYLCVRTCISFGRTGQSYTRSLKHFSFLVTEGEGKEDRSGGGGGGRGQDLFAMSKRAPRLRRPCVAARRAASLPGLRLFRARRPRTKSSTSCKQRSRCLITRARGRRLWRIFGRFLLESFTFRLAKSRHQTLLKTISFNQHETTWGRLAIVGIFQPASPLFSAEAAVMASTNQLWGGLDNSKSVRSRDR